MAAVETTAFPATDATNRQKITPGTRRPKVVVVGAGFGGLHAARALAGKPVDVLLVDRHNYHLFQPLLYQVATAGLEPEEIAYPVRRIIGKLPNVEFCLAEVTGLDLDGRELRTDGKAIPYDYLILAPGSDNNFFGMRRLAEHAAGLKNLPQAVGLRNQVLSCFERAEAMEDSPERSALLTFVIGGGGPTGVEFAGALAELVHLVLARDYKRIRRDEVRMLLVEGGKDLLSMVSPSLRRSALEELGRKGVEVMLDTEIKDFDGHTVTIGNGQEIATATLMWAAGVRASSLGSETGEKLARHGTVPVQASLQLAAHPEVYVVGDLAALEQDGQPLPMLAPVAIQQGETAAANVVRDVQGLPPQSFRYRSKGTLATIGRNAAVAQFGPIGLSGFPAWITWLLVHLVLLIGFRNRIVVLINWAWSYISFDRALRLITGG